MIATKRTNWKTYAFWILLSLGVGGLSGWLTREGVRIYNETVQQPPQSPPAWIFPIVWGILYTLMEFSVARFSLAEPSKARSLGLNLFVVQLILNFFWSPIFFNTQSYGLAAVWLAMLWFIVLAMILTFRQADTLAAWVQIPYLLWLAFALYLNIGVWYLN